MPYKRRFLFSVLFCSVIFLTAVYAKKPTHYILIIGLDGISYQTAIKMHDNGYFREFRRPIPMVATFPSISDPNWAHLMDAPIERGFTKAGYSLSKNKDGSIGQEYGALLDHLTTPPQYEKYFDFKAEGVFQHLMSMTWTETSALFWTESLLRFLLDPLNTKNKTVVKAFIVNTDILSHLGGEKKVIDYLKQLDKKIQNLQKDFQAKYKKPLEIVIVSDHGNHFKTPQVIDYQEHLIKEGYNQKNTLRETTDYAFVAPEIISFGAFYVLPGEEKSFAAHLSKVKGVHVSLVDLGQNKIGVYSKEGQGEISLNPETKKIFYKIINGKDPFDQIDLFHGKPLSFSDYFYKTLSTPYPNALVRAWEGFYRNSQDKASVLVSAELGYVFTNLTLKILTAVSGVQSTHGSFHREESLGIVMSTLPLHEEALTPFEFMDLIKNL